MLGVRHWCPECAPCRDTAKKAGTFFWCTVSYTFLRDLEPWLVYMQQTCLGFIVHLSKGPVPCPGHTLQLKDSQPLARPEYEPQQQVHDMRPSDVAPVISTPLAACGPHCLTAVTNHEPRGSSPHVVPGSSGGQTSSLLMQASSSYVWRTSGSTGRWGDTLGLRNQGVTGTVFQHTRSSKHVPPQHARG